MFASLAAKAAAAGSALKKELGHAQSAATSSLSSNPAHAFVGSEVTLGGRALRVEALLAEGGFACVYLVSAVDGDGTEKFVLKKMFAGGSENVAQLTAEVRLTEQLQHPNIVKVRRGRDAGRKERGSPVPGGLRASSLHSSSPLVSSRPSTPRATSVPRQ